MHRRTSLVLALLLASSLLALPPAAAQDAFGPPEETERIDDASVIDVAITLSTRRFEEPHSAAHVVLSRDDNFADSLAGTPLTADGPLLYTTTAALPGATAAEIDRVLADGGTIFVLGGPVAVSEDVTDGLAADGYDVQRLAGPDRVSTSVEVARVVAELNPDGDTIAVARAFGVEGNPTAAWADSVTGGPWTVRDGVPIVISATDALSDPVATFLAEVAPQTTVLLGGPAALSAAVEDAVPNPRRISGPDRAATAVAIATDLLGFPADGPRNAVVFNAFRDDGWARGLAAAAVAADADAPLLVVGDAVPPATEVALHTPGDTAEVSLLAVGTGADVTAAVIERLDALDGGGAEPGDAVPPPPPPAAPPVGPLVLGEPARIDVDTQGMAAEQPAFPRGGNLVLDADGSDIGFTVADRLVAADDDDRVDLYVNSGGQPELVLPGPATGISRSNGMSDDGRVLAYFAADGDGDFDGFFVRDRASGTDTLVLEEVFGGQQGTTAVSGDGSTVWVAYRTGEREGELYRYDVAGDDLEVLDVPWPDGPTGRALDLASDQTGRRLMFSTVTPLSPQDTNTSNDVYLYDHADASTTLVSTDADGTASGTQISSFGNAADMSADGRLIFFISRSDAIAGDDGFANNADLYRHDIAAGTTQRALQPANASALPGDVRTVSVDATGARIAYSCDACRDLSTDSPGPNTAGWVTDVRTGENVIAAFIVTGQGILISADGRVVAIDENGFLNRRSVGPA